MNCAAARTMAYFPRKAKSPRKPRAPIRGTNCAIDLVEVSCYLEIHRPPEKTILY